MREFSRAYKQLNAEQKKAVDKIDGPLLVIAGPGTGKTELLSLRVANIIDKTDTLPSNILCLTFTDNAARNMRERLEKYMGQAAFHVNIHTFHSFGSDIIAKHPDFFTSRQFIQQIDELGAYELLREIFEQLPHSNPFSTKVDSEFILIRDTLSAISWLKQNALLPHELHKIVTENQKIISKHEKLVADVFAQTPSPKLLPEYQRLLSALEKTAQNGTDFGFPDYATICADELADAVSKVEPNKRFAPSITAWRNKWCEKNADNKHVFKDGGRNMRKMHALAEIYKKFTEKMRDQGLYDFDDMIIETVQALENDEAFRYTLQEQYQYILVDEFQDTNKAQLRILQALGDNPIFEGKPNIMAVGDDDQAIYAFQGAEVSNMIAFDKLFGAPHITLKENYRSTQEIIKGSYDVAHNISGRLDDFFTDVSRQLIARKDDKTGLVNHSVFNSELAQYSWIAEEIQELLTKGAKPEDIAVIAPRHRYLERLMPYLGKKRIPVAYERRENILEAKIILEIIAMAKLVVALQSNRQDDVDALLSEVLSFDFWNIPADDLVELSLEAYSKRRHWLELSRKHTNKKIVEVSNWFVSLARGSTVEPLEYMLDQFVGVTPRDVETVDYSKHKVANFVSPMREYYFNDKTIKETPDAYLALLGQLSTLRQKLRQWKPSQALFVNDFVDFIELHRQAKLKIIDTNPHTQTTKAVQVMTAYKAKGLEFETVFVINAQDEVWGPTTRSASRRISLPKNLPIAPASDGDNDKLRLLFVALTRAKRRLHITGYTNSLDNKLSPGLSFIGGHKDNKHDLFKPNFVDKPPTAEAVEILSTDWEYRFRKIIASQKALFEPILQNYKLSVTHLNNFIDIRQAGPNYFFLHNLLRFPEAPTPAASYGDAMHQTLKWLHDELRSQGKLPAPKIATDYFEDMLRRKHLKKSEFKKFNQKGHDSLGQYIKQRSQRFSPKDLAERGFNNDGVVISGAELSGKIDKMSFASAGSVRVVDFKTGKPARDWRDKDDYEKIKLHRYRQQLLFYKLLIENSASYHKKITVTSGALEFIEPDENGHLVDDLEIEFDVKELEKFTKLIGAIWNKIMNLDFPDIKGYSQNYKGVLAFEQDLIDGKI